MTTTSSDSLTAAAHRYLWMHFTPMPGSDTDIPIIVRGEGAWVYDQNGKRYLDGLAGLFVSQVGHGRDELADAASSACSSPPAAARRSSPHGSSPASTTSRSVNRTVTR
jgi:adenosylmethionine-8-amino-7-oxononanoate aminotransferase